MTRPLRSACLLFGLLFLSTAPGLSDPAPAIYPLREVRAGQRAVAKSVFRGTRVESFNLEVLGVLNKYDGTRSVILARVLDGPVVTRKSGVLGGMSGSPVYIGGRLAGAIALTWAYSKEPIAGITPIEEMLPALAEQPATEQEPGSTGGDRWQPVRLAGEVISRVRVSSRPPADPDPPGVMTLVPLSGFVQVSGFNSRGIERVSELLEPYGLQAIPGPSGSEEQMRPPLVPGAALGATLVRGDFDMTALGTVTLVEGDRVLGFGHPILQRGAVDLPMTGGYVHDIMPSLYVSNKIMSPTQVVGRVFRDHQSAIAGRIGGKADLLPVSIEVTDTDSGRSRAFEIEVVRLRNLMPGLVASSILTAVDETRGRIARGTARVFVELDAEGHPPIRREEFMYSDYDAAAAASPAVLLPLALFTDSPFGDLRINRLRVRVEAEEVRNTASIERVTVAQSRISAGDEITLSVAVRPYGRDMVEVPVQLALPADLPRGQIRVSVTGGGDSDQARATIGAPRPQPVSLGQLLERYTAEEKGSELVVYAALPRGGVSLLGEELPDLPRSALDALRATHRTDLRPSPSLLKVVVPTQWVLTGRQMLALQIESPIAPGRPGPPRPPIEGPPPKGEEEAVVFGFPSPLPAEQTALRSPVAPEFAAAQRQAANQGAAKKEEEPKPFTRAPEAWVQADGSDHAEAKLEQVTVREDGRLSLAPETVDVATLESDVVWSVAARGGVAYVGTGSKGLVYRISAEGDVSELYATGEMNVHALALDDEGDVYAATSPRGKLFRIAGDGSGELVYDSESTYLWCLVVGPDGTIYAGGGSPARVYAIGPDGEARVLAELPAANVLSLALSTAGDLYAGTADNGVVYRVRPDGSASAIYQVSGDSADALALDDEGNLYVSASPGGAIYRIPAEGLPELYCETRQRTIYGLRVLPNGDLVVASGSRDLLARIGSDRKPEVILRADAGLATALAQDGGAIFVGSSAPCSVRKLGPDLATSGRLESTMLDAGDTARWGRMDWMAEAPEGTGVSAETRSGDSPMPDDHWSGWTDVTAGIIASPPARYLQYRLTLTTEETPTAPVVQQIRVSHRPRNGRPMCALKTPSGGDYLSKKQAMAWQARDPDKDTLTFEVAISADLGKTWKQLKQDLREPKYEWDTTKQKDGRYLLRLTASDSLSVPSEPLSAEVSIGVWVDNTAPEIGLLKSSLVVGEDRRAAVAGWARDALSPIQSVEYRVDEEKWRSVALGSVESSLAGAYVADLSVTTEALKAGSHSLDVRVFDAAGNVATDSLPVKVEKGEEEAGAEAAAEEDEDAAAAEAEEGEDVTAAEADEDASGEAEEEAAVEGDEEAGEDEGGDEETGEEGAVDEGAAVAPDDEAETAPQSDEAAAPAE
jgi:sugar lactone lactonase YvrE